MNTIKTGSPVPIVFVKDKETGDVVTSWKYEIRNGYVNQITEEKFIEKYMHPSIELTLIDPNTEEVVGQITQTCIKNCSACQWNGNCLFKSPQNVQ